MKNLFFSLSLIFLMFTSCKPEDELQITNISFDSTQVKLNEGESIILSIKQSPANLPAPKYSWISQFPYIATVNNGIVKGISGGTTKIRVTSLSNQALTAECTVIVKIVGSSENPYLIYTVQDLIKVRDSINSGNLEFSFKVFKLMADLDFANEHYWTPIGPSVTLPFRGIFDGNGKSIINMKIGTANTIIYIDYAGLFGCIKGGSVKNLGVQWSNINTKFTAGGIAGLIFNGTIINNCYSTGDIHGDFASGGIVGKMRGGEISNSNSKGSITSLTNYSNSYSGGIVADVSDGKIINCYSTGVLTGSTTGGITGNATNGITIKNSFSSGNINGFYAGGIVGEAIDLTIENSFSSGNINGIYAGGIVGEAINLTIESCYSTGNIEGQNLSGGIVSFITGDYIVNLCYSTGQITSSETCGGIIGSNAESTIRSTIINSYSTGNVSSFGSYGSHKAGGIAGFTRGVIINCYSTGTVSSEVIPHSGGIAGVLEGTINNCYSSGAILANNNDGHYFESYSGGIAGIVDYSGKTISTISHCIALNSSIIATGSHFDFLLPARIANIESAVVSNNYASTIMIVKKGTSLITNFPNTLTLCNGLDLSDPPLDLLNSYITTNPTYNGITLSKWKIDSAVNNGYPIFE